MDLAFAPARWPRRSPPRARQASGIAFRALSFRRVLAGRPVNEVVLPDEEQVQAVEPLELGAPLLVPYQDDPGLCGVRWRVGCEVEAEVKARGLGDALPDGGRPGGE